MDLHTPAGFASPSPQQPTCNASISTVAIKRGEFVYARIIDF